MKILSTLLLFVAMVSTAIAQTPNGSACKISQRNWCGSGSLCGYAEDGSGAYILTNAHVSGSSLNDPMDCLFKMPDGGERRFSANPIIIAYTNRSVDWCIGFIPGLTADSGLKPVKLSKTGNPRVGVSFSHTGSPRCVWPQPTIKATTVQGLGVSGVSFFLPVSIGGQSGSSLWRVNEDGKKQVEILLTWSYGRGANALGAGQPTRLIFENIVNKNAIGPKPIDGLIEVGTWQDRGLQEGYFEAESTTKALGIAPAARALRVKELPIWVEDDVAPPEPPAGGLTAAETKSALGIKTMGYDLPSVETWLRSLKPKTSTQVEPQLSGPLGPFDSSTGIKVNRPGPDPTPAKVESNITWEDYGDGWEPPPGELTLNMTHNGRVLVKVDGVLKFVKQ